MPVLLQRRFDGGSTSGVTGFFFVESKKFGSIALLHFSEGSREAVHSHAFDALTWWLKGSALEETYDIETGDFVRSAQYQRTLRPKFTPKEQMHRVLGGPTGGWAFTIRGPWAKYWYERRAPEAVEGSDLTRFPSLVKLGWGRSEEEVEDGCGCC